MRRELQKLIDRYKREKEALKESNNYNQPTVINTVGVLREIIFDLENLLKGKK